MNAPPWREALRLGHERTLGFEMESRRRAYLPFRLFLMFEKW